MSNLRSLIFGISLLPFSVHAVGYKFSQQFDYQSSVGSTAISSQSTSNRISSSTGSFKYSVTGIKNVFDINSSVSISRPDYSNFVVQNSNGATSSLGERYRGLNEVMATLNLGYTVRETTVFVEGGGHLTESPFATRFAGVGLSQGFYNKSTVIGLKYSVSQINQPDSYYTNVDFTAHQRPLLIHANEMSFYAEQILNEKWKGRLELGTYERYEDRPRNYAVTLKTAYALSNRVFSNFAIGQISEDRVQSLKNERGYYDVRFGEVGLTVEPVYDWLITGSYILAFETEYDPRTNNGVRVGSDQYGVGLAYADGPWKYQVKGAYRATNISLNDFILSGGLEWQM